MYKSKTLFITAAILMAGSLSGSSVATGISLDYGVYVTSGKYEFRGPFLEPNLLSNTVQPFQHRLVAAGFDPNAVQIQRRIRQGWYTEADPTKHCIDVFGNLDDSCQWHDWNMDWQFAHRITTDVNIYTVDVNIAGNAYANWPLFPDDEGTYAPNPNFTQVNPMTKYIIETRYLHPTVGWLYDAEGLVLWCDGKSAWAHYSGVTTCPGL